MKNFIIFLLVAIVGLTSATATFANSVDPKTDVAMTAQEKAFAAGMAQVLAEEQARITAEEVRLAEVVKAQEQKLVDDAFAAGVAAAKKQLNDIAKAKAEAKLIADAAAKAEAKAKAEAEAKARLESFNSFKADFNSELTAESTAKIEKLQAMLVVEFNKQVADIQNSSDISISEKDKEIASITSSYESKLTSLRTLAKGELDSLNAKLSQAEVDSLEEIRLIEELNVSDMDNAKKVADEKLAETIKQHEVQIVELKAASDTLIDQARTAAVNEVNRVTAEAEVNLAKVKEEAFNSGVKAAQEAFAIQQQELAISEAESAEAKAAELRAKIALIEKNKNDEIEAKNDRITEIQVRLGQLDTSTN